MSVVVSGSVNTGTVTFSNYSVYKVHHIKMLTVNYTNWYVYLIPSVATSASANVIFSISYAFYIWVFRYTLEINITDLCNLLIT
jgi:hypothetical protein